MTKPAKLTDTRIRSVRPADKPIKLLDGGGMYLLVNPNGSRLWRYRYRLNGKENLFALGEYGIPPNRETSEAKAIRIAGGIFSLAEAREAQAKARALVKAGLHPSAARAETRRITATAQETTFEGVAREWLSRAAVKWKPDSYGTKKRLLEADVFPTIGKRPIAELKRIDLNTLILKIEKRAPHMAILARRLLQAIFDHAETTGAVAESIALRLAKIEIPKTTHARQLPLADIGPFLRDCELYKGAFHYRTAMKLAWLTLVRSNEILEAEWVEFDFEQAIWRIPAARMKMERDHIIPLSHQAVQLLRELHVLTGSLRHLIPNRIDRNRPAAHGRLWNMVEKIGWIDRFSPHGLRGTASTIMNESGLWAPDVIERLLAHTDDNKVRASYNAAEYLAQRKAALQWWADLLDTKYAEACAVAKQQEE